MKLDDINTKPTFVVSIVSIQADQSRRNSAICWWLHCWYVSIVSIQADQSRPRLTIASDLRFNEVSIVSIQADQSRRWIHLHYWYYCHWFQSYQFRQINPDYSVMVNLNSYRSSFNRINSGRSIPTRCRIFNCYWIALRFNRINSGRSIPTT